MTNKAIFHGKGEYAKFNSNTEKYESIEVEIRLLSKKIKDLQDEINAIKKRSRNNSGEKSAEDIEHMSNIEMEVKGYKNQLHTLSENAVKLIDLSHMAFIFLDTGGQIQTKRNVIRGLQ
jgi:predicted  nucleic acid-binding Zn-ribbon protein